MSDPDTIIIMVSAVVVAVVMGIIGYKVIKKYFADGGGGAGCPTFRPRRGGRVGGVGDEEADGVGNRGERQQSATRDLFGSLLPQRRIPQLIFDFPPETRAGDSVSFRISLPEPASPRGLLGLGGSRSQAPLPPADQNANSTIIPPGSESSTLTLTRPPSRRAHLLNNKISIEVKKIIGDPEKITVIREFIVDTATNEDILLATFSVHESGFYEIHVHYDNNGDLKGSPYFINILPGLLDLERTGLIRQSPTMVCKAGNLYAMNIEPKDRFGNLCRAVDIELHKFEFRVLHVDQNTQHSPLVEAMTYNFTAVAFDEWGESTSLVRLETEVFLPGVFQGLLTYGGSGGGGGCNNDDKLISNGAFDIVILSAEEHVVFEGARAVTLTLGGGSAISQATAATTLYHEAKLLALNAEVQKKAKTVYVYVYPKQLAVKEFFLGIIPSRVAVFRILPATKMKLLVTNPGSGTTTFTIQDRVQPKVTLEMSTPSHRVTMALFAHFLHQRLGGSESFENKQKFFYEEVKNAREEKARPFIPVRVSRENLVDSSLVETKGFGVKEWCRKFKVQFLHEIGMDDGGLRREWLELLCTKMFENNATGMFCSIGSSRLVHPNPLATRSAAWTLKHYEFAGKVVGKCLFETSIGGFYKQMVNGRFSRSFLGQVIGFMPHYKYFELDDPELYLGKVKYILENDVQPMELSFTEEEYNSNGSLVKTVDLVPNGAKIAVTNDNKEDYLNALATYRLGTRVEKEMEAFLKGLNEIIPDGLLTNFDENELEILMCGKSTFSTADLKAHHVVSETEAGAELHKILRWFWTCVENMTDSERGNLLQFTTGSSLLPHGGFKELRPTFRITLTNSSGRLPIAHTCFNEICLSRHKTYEEFEKSLRTAVNECSEGFALM